MERFQGPFFSITLPILFGVVFVVGILAYAYVYTRSDIKKGSQRREKPAVADVELEPDSANVTEQTTERLATLYTRSVVRTSEQNVVAWSDIVTSAPPKHITSWCRWITQRDVSGLASIDAFTIDVEHSCVTRQPPPTPADIGPSYLMSHPDWDVLAAELYMADRSLDSSVPLTLEKTFVSRFDSEESCQRAVSLWQTQQKKERKQANDTTAAWLDKAISEAQENVNAACTEDSASCEEARAVLSLLIERQQELTTHQTSPPDEPKIECVRFDPQDSEKEAP